MPAKALCRVLPHHVLTVAPVQDNPSRSVIRVRDVTTGACGWRSTSVPWGPGLIAMTSNYVFYVVAATVFVFKVRCALRTSFE